MDDIMNHVTSNQADWSEKAIINQSARTQGKLSCPGTSHLQLSLMPTKRSGVLAGHSWWT